MIGTGEWVYGAVSPLDGRLRKISFRRALLLVLTVGGVTSGLYPVFAEAENCWILSNHFFDKQK